MNLSGMLKHRHLPPGSAPSSKLVAYHFTAIPVTSNRAAPFFIYF